MDICVTSYRPTGTITFIQGQQCYFIQFYQCYYIYLGLVVLYHIGLPVSNHTVRDNYEIPHSISDLSRLLKPYTFTVWQSVGPCTLVLGLCALLLIEVQQCYRTCLLTPLVFAGGMSVVHVHMYAVLFMQSYVFVTSKHVMKYY